MNAAAASPDHLTLPAAGPNSKLTIPNFDGKNWQSEY
jgi:hypothetical protein